MSSNLGIGKTLELLDRLKGTVRELTARGDKLNQDVQAGTARERRRREALAEEHATQLSATIGEASATFAAARSASSSRTQP